MADVWLDPDECAKLTAPRPPMNSLQFDAESIARAVGWTVDEVSRGHVSFLVGEARVMLRTSDLVYQALLRLANR
jgi:hypothetical protein